MYPEYRASQIFVQRLLCQRKIGMFEVKEMARVRELLLTSGVLKREK
jgi:hypothetical protein